MDKDRERLERWCRAWERLERDLADQARRLQGAIRAGEPDPDLLGIVDAMRKRLEAFLEAERRSLA